MRDSSIIIATDSSELETTLYEADRHFIVPKITEEGYFEVIIDICKDVNIKEILTLIDSEIELLVK